MAIKAAVGQAFSVEGREAIANAVYQARLSLGNARVDFALITASFEYDFQAIFNAAQTQIGDVPMIGFSTSGELTSQGSHRRSVVVALLSDDQLECTSDWLPGFSDHSGRITQEMIRSLKLTSEQKGLLLLVADGLNGDYEEAVSNLPPGRYQLAGCLAGGDMRLGRTHQLGGNRSGAGGLAAAFLSGKNLKVGVGTAHGWQPVGAKFNITKVHGPWIRSLDDKPASEGYARMFGKQARDWSFPPLNTLVRLYPLGIERNGQPLVVRTPLRVETDGSLRMSAELKENSVGHLLVGSRDKCIEAARQAAADALERLDGAAPKLAFVMADLSWQILFQGYEGTEIAAIRQVLGDDVIIAGGYTFGQFTHLAGTSRPEFLNQHIEILLFGE